MVYLVVGRTGSGKDYLVNKLEKKGLTQVISYTTRPRRNDKEKSHIFITRDESEKQLCKVTKTVINEYEYFATKEQVENADIYIIDPDAIDTLVRNMPDTEFQIVYVEANDELNRRINAVKRANDKIKEETVFEERNASENEEFTKFENIIHSEMDQSVCFAQNISCVILFKNDYSDECMERYAEQLFTRKAQLKNMTKIVNECMDIGVLAKNEQVDSYGNAKVSIWQSNDQGNKKLIPCTAEACASRLLGNENDFNKIIKEYIAFSPRFNHAAEV